MAALTYPEEVLWRTQQPMADAVNRFADRQARLEDIASARQFEETAAARASQRRMKEYSEQERQKLIQKYAEMGVPVKADDSIEQANTKFRKFASDRAGNMLDSYTNQLKDNAEQKQGTISDFQRLTTKQADPIIQREALTVTLANPAAVKDIPAAQLQQLKAVLQGPGDPAKVVQKVYDYMQSNYWFRKGAAQNKASAFYQTYLTELNSRLDKSKQIDASLLMNKLNDLDRAGQDILHQRDLHIAGNAAFLTKDQIQQSHDAHPISIPANPADVFSKDTPAPGPPPAPAAATDSMGPPPAPAGPTSASEAFDRGGFAGANAYVDAQVSARNAGNRRALAKAGSNVMDAITGGFMSQPSGAAPTAAAVQANRAAINQKIVIQPTPGEIPKVHALAKQLFGLSDDQINAADTALKNGTADQQTIKGHNYIMQIIRGQASPPPMPGATTAGADVGGSPGFDAQPAGPITPQ